MEDIIRRVALRFAAKTKLNPTQLEVLKGLPRYYYPGYRDIKKLVDLGLAVQLKPKEALERPKFERTPAGDSYLKDI